MNPLRGSCVSERSRCGGVHFSKSPTNPLRRLCASDRSRCGAVQIKLEDDLPESIFPQVLIQLRRRLFTSLGRVCLHAAMLNVYGHMRGNMAVLRKLLCASCACALCKLVCASCSAQVLCASDSAQVVLRKWFRSCGHVLRVLFLYLKVAIFQPELREEQVFVGFGLFFVTNVLFFWCYDANRFGWASQHPVERLASQPKVLMQMFCGWLHFFMILSDSWQLVWFIHLPSHPFAPHHGSS